MTFGQKLQGLRQRAGMSQDALAEQMNVSRQAVSRWERDETMPDTDKVVALADLFDVTTDYLLRQQVQTHTPPRRETHATEPEKGDWTDKLAYLARTKGYLLGWVLVVWGAADLLGVLSTAMMVNGFFFNFKIDALLSGVVEGPASGIVTGMLWLPALYGVVKLVSGILVLRYGKRYAEQAKEEQK